MLPWHTLQKMLSGFTNSWPKSHLYNQNGHHHPLLSFAITRARFASRRTPHSTLEPNISTSTFILFVRLFLKIISLWITYQPRTWSWTFLPSHFRFTSFLVFVHFLVFAETESSSRGSVEIIETTVINIRKNTLSLEHPRKYPKGCPNTT